MVLPGAEHLLVAVVPRAHHGRAQRARQTTARCVTSWNGRRCRLANADIRHAGVCLVLGGADSAVLGLLEDKKEYGKQRLWGQFGFGLAGCAVGPLLMNKRFGYRAAFYAHALISIPTLLIMRRLTPSPAPKETPKFKKGFSVLLHNPDAIVFFLSGRQELLTYVSWWRRPQKGAFRSCT